MQRLQRGRHTRNAAQQQLMLAQRAMLGAMHSLDGQLRDAVSAHAYEAAVVATAVRGAAECDRGEAVTKDCDV